MAAGGVSVSDSRSGPDSDAAQPASAPCGAAQPTAAFVAPAQPMAARTVSVSPSGRGPDSAPAQSASAPGGAAQPTFSALPDDASELTVAFYNVGIHLSEVDGRGWQIKERRSASDLAKAFGIRPCLA